MGIIKEYRIVMPVTVEEYRIAQIYMTARTQAMEAEQVSHVEFLVVRDHTCSVCVRAHARVLVCECGGRRSLARSAVIPALLSCGRKMGQEWRFLKTSQPPTR